jgi:hypothetical protein
MKVTKISTLIAVLLAAAALGYFATRLLVSRGLGVPVSALNLVMALVLISVVLLLLAIPIFRYRAALKPDQTIRPKRVDPFYAVRVVLLAKATSIAGAVFAGWHIGVLGYQLASPVLVAESLWRNSFGLVGSLLMVIAGLITELICRLPPESDSSDAAAAL